MIFERYGELGSTTELAEELCTRGVVTKQRSLSTGRVYGGRAFSRGALAHLLKNPVYIGEITHREQVYPGEHPPIVERELWDGVQALLADNRHERRHSSRAAEPSLLVGIISDGLGRPMTPTHATKGTRRYRYYVSRTEAGDPHRPWRLPAHALEQAVFGALARAIGEGRELTSRLGQLSGETAELIHERCLDLAKQLDPTQPRRAVLLMAELGVRVQVHDDRLVIGAEPEALLALVLGEIELAGG